MSPTRAASALMFLSLAGWYVLALAHSRYIDDNPTPGWFTVLFYVDGAVFVAALAVLVTVGVARLRRRLTAHERPH